MKELQAIVDRVMQAQQSTTFMLATVVNIRGSSYRRPGARMLITADGACVGTISGGCLEQDVIEQAQQVLQSGETRLITYDSMDEDDLIWGLGLGCNGVVQVLVERLETDDLYNSIRLVAQGLETQQPSVLVNIFQVEGCSTVAVGERLLLCADGSILSTIDDPHVRQVAIADAQKAIKDGKSCTVRYTFAGGAIDALVEVIQPAIPLTIFGAGPDVLPIVQLAKALGWQVTVVDCRARDASLARFSTADQVILARSDRLVESVAISDRTAAVVMTHNYLDDLAVLSYLLATSTRYIGCLGPKSRFNRLRCDLSNSGIHLSAEQLKHLYAPVGLDIGADTPEANAVSILAEIQAVLAHRTGQFLRDRPGPIHASFGGHTQPIHRSPGHQSGCNRSLAPISTT